MDISIIIVTWKVKDLLDKCLKSVFEHTKDIDFEVIVVDNGSRDGTVDMVQSKYPEIKLLSSKHNLGFARASNLGFSRAEGRYVLFLNPDTEFFDNAIADTVNLMDKNKKWDIMGPRLLNSDHTTQSSVRNFPTLRDQSIIMLKAHHLPFFRRSINRYLHSTFNYSLEAKVNQIMGAFMVMPKRVFEDLGQFDEKYFCWFEEVDLCRTARKREMTIVYTPDISLIHHGGASFSQLNWHKQLIWNHSLIHYFIKHGKRSEAFMLWLLQPFSIVLAIFASFFTCRKNHE